MCPWMRNCQSCNILIGLSANSALYTHLYGTAYNTAVEQYGVLGVVRYRITEYNKRQSYWTGYICM